MDSSQNTQSVPTDGGQFATSNGSVASTPTPPSSSSPRKSKKKLIIAGVILFNLLLLGAVLFIGQGISQNNTSYKSNAAGVTPVVQLTPTGAPSCGDFEDVPQDNPFYTYIRCLDCNDIVSGYQCGAPPAGQCVPPANKPYYLPLGDVTRGQLAKIVSMSAHYNDTIPSTQQTFSDVAPSDTFWVDIERVYTHGAITGYPCGVAPAGPCDRQNRPYYLPNNPLTRGQATKVIVTALGYTGNVSGLQNFSDVPTSYIFHDFIELAYANHIVDGYRCGVAPAGPCDAQNRPYFLPNNNMIRGQAAKMAALGWPCVMPTASPSPSVGSGILVEGRVKNMGTAPIPPFGSCTANSPAAVGVNGIKVTMRSADGTVREDTTHNYFNDTGAFQFFDTQPGTYTICSQTPPGTQFMCADPQMQNSECITVTVSGSRGYLRFYFGNPISPTGPVPPTKPPTPTISGPQPTCTPPPQCVIDNQCDPVEPPGGWCPPPTPSGPAPTCTPRPACLDAKPPCDIPEPGGGWCPPTSITPTPTCTMPPECVVKGYCDIAIPPGGWCPITPTPTKPICP
jgi:hypothetical protein